MTNLTPIIDYQVFSLKENLKKIWYFESLRDKIILVFFWVVGIISTAYFTIKWFL
jgi:hypothetical protein